MWQSATLRVGAAITVAIMTTSCAIHDLALEKDRRIRIIAPRSMQKLDPPFAMRWTSTIPDDGAYAVFIDHAPMAPGATLREYTEELCQGTVCPIDTPEALTAWLEQRGIFTTESTRLKVPFIIARGESTEKDTRNAHEAIIVRLDADGRRVGESAWAVSFRVPQRNFGE